MSLVKSIHGMEAVSWSLLTHWHSPTVLSRSMAISGLQKAGSIPNRSFLSSNHSPQDLPFKTRRHPFSHNKNMFSNMPFTKQAPETPSVPAVAMPWLDTMPQQAAPGQAKEGLQEGAQSQSYDQAQHLQFLSEQISKSEMSVILHCMSSIPRPYLTNSASCSCVHI